MFGNPENAASELRLVLPAEASALIDWPSLKLCPGSFVDPQLVERHTDLLFTVRYAGRDAQLYVLFEHQSTPDRFLLRDARSSKNLLADLQRWAHDLAKIAEPPSGVEALAALLECALRVGEIPRQDLEQFARQLGPLTTEAFMTTAEIIAKEGEIRGEAKGKAEGKAY